MSTSLVVHGTCALGLTSFLPSVHLVGLERLESYNCHNEGNKSLAFPLIFLRKIKGNNFY